MSCIHCLLGLPWCRDPSMIPSRTVSANCPALPRVMWPKYCSFSFATLPINSLSRPNSINIELFVRCSCHEMLSMYKNGQAAWVVVQERSKTTIQMGSSWVVPLYEISRNHSYTLWRFTATHTLCWLVMMCLFVCLFVCEYLSTIKRKPFMGMIWNLYCDKPTDFGFKRSGAQGTLQYADFAPQYIWNG